MLTKEIIKPNPDSVYWNKPQPMGSNICVEVKVWSILESHTVEAPELGNEFCFVFIGLTLCKCWVTSTWRM